MKVSFLQGLILLTMVNEEKHKEKIPKTIKLVENVSCLYNVVPHVAQMKNAIFATFYVCHIYRRLKTQLLCIFYLISF